MNPSSFLSRLPIPRAGQWFTLVSLAALGIGLAACGGGVGTGGTGSFAAGPITGFGSVIVNDVRYDDSTARVEDADGLLRSRDDLRLGMTVEVDGSAIETGAAGAAATASRVRIASEMLGPVASVDRTAGRFLLLGQSVLVDATTVFDDSLSGGLAALAPGRIVEVHAAFDPAAAAYRATRVEAKSSTPAAWRLRGVVAALDANARSFAIGAARFGYAGAGAVPTALANGQFVRLQLQPTAAGTALWTVLSFGSALPPLPESSGAKLRGVVSSSGAGGRISVNGQPVDTSSASFPDGPLGGPGQRVEVEGTVRNGVLVASKVSIESEQRQRDRRIDLRGPVSSVDVPRRQFVIRNVTVSWARSDLRVDDGTLAQIVVGRQLEVEGLLAADGTRVEATRIRFR